MTPERRVMSKTEVRPLVLGLRRMGQRWSPSPPPFYFGRDPPPPGPKGPRALAGCHLRSQQQQSTQASAAAMLAAEAAARTLLVV